MREMRLKVREMEIPSPYLTEVEVIQVSQQ